MNEQKRDAVSRRKPYQPEITATWWNKLWYYRFYILRESTAIFMIWFSMLLMYAMTCIATDEFYRFIFFVRHPAVIVFNVITLLAALLHTATWFNLAPKAINLVIGGRKLPAIISIAVLWIVTIVASVLLFYSVLS